MAHGVLPACSSNAKVGSSTAPRENPAAQASRSQFVDVTKPLSQDEFLRTLQEFLTLPECWSRLVRGDLPEGVQRSAIAESSAMARATVIVDQLSTEVESLRLENQELKRELIVASSNARSLQEQVAIDGFLYKLGDAALDGSPLPIECGEFLQEDEQSEKDKQIKKLKMENAKLMSQIETSVSKDAFTEVFNLVEQMAQELDSLEWPLPGKCPSSAAVASTASHDPTACSPLASSRIPESPKGTSSSSFMISSLRQSLIRLMRKQGALVERILQKDAMLASADAEVAELRSERRQPFEPYQSFRRRDSKDLEAYVRRRDLSENAVMHGTVGARSTTGPTAETTSPCDELQPLPEQDAVPPSLAQADSLHSPASSSHGPTADDRYKSLEQRLVEMAELRQQMQLALDKRKTGMALQNRSPSPTVTSPGPKALQNVVAPKAPDIVAIESMQKPPESATSHSIAAGLGSGLQLPKSVEQRMLAELQRHCQIQDDMIRQQRRAAELRDDVMRSRCVSGANTPILKAQFTPVLDS